MKLMTFDVGGTDIKYAVIDSDYSLTNTGDIPTPDNNHTIEDFVNTIDELYNQYGEGTEGIAMSLPGFIDTKNGLQNGGGALKYLQFQPIGKLISEKCGCPVHLENDGKAAAIAELGNGVLKGCENAAVFIIGTGVGGGIITQGKLLRGKTFTAGEFSFIDVDINQPEDNFNGMLAFYCSTSALLGRYNAISETKIENGKQFFAKYFENDENAINTLAWFTHNVATQILNLGILINAEKVAIGGGISKQPILTEKIRESLDELSLAQRMKKSGAGMIIPEVVTCHYSADANLIGAYISYLDEMI